jgi:hypothetical protein
MTPATNARLLEHIDAAAAKIVALPVRAAATISSDDGRYVTGGTVEISATNDGWTGRMRHLDRPGIVARMYCADGIREVVVRLEDGRRGRARITGTSFIAATQRVCDLVGLEPLD